MTCTKQIVLTERECGTCGIMFAVPQEWLTTRVREGGGIYCPNGCHRVWRESEADKLRKQLEEKERALTASKCETMRANQLLQEERAAKAKTDKKLRRVHKGVYPCCNRSFTNLRRHMETKHPEAKPVSTP